MVRGESQHSSTIMSIILFDNIILNLLGSKWHIFKNPLVRIYNAFHDDSNKFVRSRVWVGPVVL